MHIDCAAICPIVLSKTRICSGGSGSQMSLRSAWDHVLQMLIWELEPLEHPGANAVFAEYKVVNPKDFLKASISLVEGVCLFIVAPLQLLTGSNTAIDNLYSKVDILHRDIPVNNLMVEADDHSKGGLN